MEGGGAGFGEGGGKEVTGEVRAGAGEGQERASAKVFSLPGTCTMELMNSAI